MTADGDQRGLAGIRVVELGGMVAAPYATKLLADLGADVVKIEPPDGDRSRHRGPFRGDADPEASGLFVYLNTNKRSVVADVDDDEGRVRVRDLVAGSDVVVSGLTKADAARTGMGWDDLAAVRPGLVMCSITPFGLTGPYSDHRAEEITTVHAGGWGFVSPGASPHPELPPLKPFGHQADFQSGIAAATATLAAFDKAERTGVGEHIDFCQMAHVAGIIETAFIGYTYLGTDASRLGTRVANPWGIFDAVDDAIFVVTPEQDQWTRLKAFMGSPEWADLEIFADAVGRNNADDILHLYLAEWIAGREVDDLFHRGQAERIPFAPVHTMAQMAADPHLAARGFLVEADQPGLGPVRRPGRPSKLTNDWWELRTPAPALGEHTTSAAFDRTPPAARFDARSIPERPLAGITVADFSWVWAGPYASMHLAHLGADVVKIESSVRLDLGRRLPLFVPGMEGDPDACGYFNQWAQGKRSLALDLGHPDGPALARRLALSCDVVLSNFGTGVVERLGIDHTTLAVERPDIICAQISGYGQTGPYRSYTGYGPTTAPLSGLSSLTGYAGHGPSEVGISIGDPAAGIATAYAIVAALVARRRTGEGQNIDTSLWEATAVNVAEGWMAHELTGDAPERDGNHDPSMAPHDVYRAAGEDAWVTIACATDDEWRALVTVIEGDGVGSGLGDDARFATAAARKHDEAALDALIGDWTRRHDRWEIAARLQAVGVAAFPSLSPGDLAEDPHLAARSFVERLDHPVVGRRAHAGVPWLTCNAANGVTRPAPCLGEHTDEVLAERLGLDAAGIAAVRATGVLR